MSNSHNFLCQQTYLKADIYIHVYLIKHMLLILMVRSIKQVFNHTYLIKHMLLTLKVRSSKQVFNLTYLIKHMLLIPKVRSIKQVFNHTEIQNLVTNSNTYSPFLWL